VGARPVNPSLRLDDNRAGSAFDGDHSVWLNCGVETRLAADGAQRPRFELSTNLHWKLVLHCSREDSSWSEYVNRCQAATEGL